MKKILLSLLIAALCVPLAAEEKARKVLSHEDMKYPPEALKKGNGGFVTLKVPVNADGTVNIEKATSASQDTVLVDACKKNANTWKFAPGKSETLELTYMFRVAAPNEKGELIFKDDQLLTSISAPKPPGD